MIRYIKGAKAIPLVELVVPKECTFNEYLQNGNTLEYMNFKQEGPKTYHQTDYLMFQLSTMG